ncbi:MAG: hypothetical protein A3K83_06475 [Omnitrophica WOR_2 bacterium RBG_13_44_8b]|nr:MAG: hypothetical protein A3K83_06475 [Omnitrophica WOR_2 bacterium RBG_13_44_8b]
MKIKVLIAVLIFGISLAVLNIRVYAYDDGDFQVWNTDTEEFKINNDTKMVWEEEFRWGDDSREFYYHHYDLGFSFNLKKYLSVAGGYRHVLSLQANKWKIENEPYVSATLSGAFKGLPLDTRSRIEYRHFDYKADSWRYRNKFTVKLPWKFTALNIQPYISDEIFVIFGGTCQFNQNRISCGLGTDITRNVKAEVYYLLDSSKNSKGKWTDANVLGTKLKITF